MEAKRYGLSILGAQTAMSAQDQELRVKQAIRIPPHSGILTQAKKISRRLSEQHLRGERQESGWARRMSGHAKQAGVRRLQHRGEREVCDGKALSTSSIESILRLVQPLSEML
jgi:hypothetical protein